jgi:hypothetical protein
MYYSKRRPLGDVWEGLLVQPGTTSRFIAEVEDKK